MNGLKALSILVLFSFIACTQLVEDNEGKNTYTGDDGCVYCHTDQTRLKALAVEEESDHSGGGG